MNAARRAKQKANRYADGGHSVLDHQRRPDPGHPGKWLPVNCTDCRTPVTSGFREETRRAQLLRPNLPKGWSYKFKVPRRRSRTKGGAHAIPHGRG